MLAAMLLCLSPGASIAQLSVTGGGSAAANGGGGGGPPPGVAPQNTALPRISGLDTVGSTLTAKTGAWTGTAPITYTYNWHAIGGSSLGTASTFGPLTSGVLGQRLPVDVTATNASGAATATAP